MESAQSFVSSLDKVPMAVLFLFTPVRSVQVLVSYAEGEGGRGRFKGVAVGWVVFT